MQTARSSVCCAQPNNVRENKQKLCDVSGKWFRAMLPAEVCRSCGYHIFDEASINLFRIGVAMQLIAQGVHTGSAHKYCRQAINMSLLECTLEYKILYSDARAIERMESGAKEICPQFWPALSARVKAAYEQARVKAGSKMPTVSLTVEPRNPHLQAT
jgi:hypothetical protein